MNTHFNPIAKRKGRRLRRQSVKARMLPFYAFTFLCLAAFSACGKHHTQADASGIFEATEVVVSAQTAGEIEQLDLTEGQILSAGARIGYIDTVQLHWQRTALLARIRATGSRAYDVAVQSASLRQQIQKQETELARFRQLQEANAATQKQVDDIAAAIAVLQKQLAAQTDNLRQGNAGVSSEVEALQAQLAQVEDLLDKSIITSPIEGTALAKYAERGELAMQGKPLFKVADMKRIFLKAYITADQLTQAKLGQPVEVYADFGQKEMKAYDGIITWISDKAEFTPRTILTRNERANQVYAVKIAVTNDGYLKIGMYGEVKLTANEQH